MNKIPLASEINFPCKQEPGIEFGVDLQHPIKFRCKMKEKKQERERKIHGEYLPFIIAAE